jgi:hypothetical protein
MSGIKIINNSAMLILRAIRNIPKIKPIIGDKTAYNIICRLTFFPTIFGSKWSI